MEENYINDPEDIDEETNKLKVEALLKSFKELGWGIHKMLKKEEILEFLNKHTKDGKEFNPLLAKKIFDILDIDDKPTKNIYEFAEGFVQVEAKLRQKGEDFMRKVATEEAIYGNLEEQCEKYKSEKINEEGFCENAKITVDIIDVKIKHKLENINSLVLQLVYNEETKQTSFEALNRYTKINKKFEFKPKSKKDHFEFILKGVNDKGNIILGNKTFPLNEITSQEEYSVNINIPELNDNNSIAAFINAKILVYWSDYQYYEDKRKKSLAKLKIFEDAVQKSNMYISKIMEIYGENSGIPNEELKIENLIEETDNKNDIPPSDQTNDPNILEFVNKVNAKSVEELYKFTLVQHIKLCGIFIFLLALGSGLWRADYPNGCAGFAVLIGFIYAMKSSIDLSKRIINYLILLLVVLIIYDIAFIGIYWDDTNLDKFTGGHENWIADIAMLLSYCNLGLKCVTIYFLWNQKNEIHDIESTDMTL